jgi:UDPglucose--hexose-1-phosphate uridylyltransferase
MPELRQDSFSGDWIILSPGRAARPHELHNAASIRVPSPQETCPFEDIGLAGNGILLGAWPNAKKWRIAVIPNKYPALVHGEACAVDFREGFYEAKTSIGVHELVITRDHKKTFADLDPATAAQLFEIFQERYRAAKDGCSAYAVAFLNYGSSVGSSIWHPHYQIMATPFVPPHIVQSLHGAEVYFKKNHRCLRCDLIREERKKKTRIIEENRNAIALTPYASKRPFEVRVTPKKHFPRFEETPRAVIADVALLMQSSLRRLRKYAGDPDLNFFIHDAPFAGGEYPYHHWHAEILPNLSYLGGLEFSTGIYINVTDPDEAAKILRGKSKQ